MLKMRRIGGSVTGMWNIKEGAALGVLLVFSYIDIRRRELPAVLLKCCGAAVLVYQLLFCRNGIWDILAGAGTGVVFLIISRVTGEKMGYGDSLGIVILGGFLGLWELLEVLTAAFFLLAAGAVITLGIKGMPRRCGLPFFPFLTCGYVVALMGRGGFL